MLILQYCFSFILLVTQSFDRGTVYTTALPGLHEPGVAFIPGQLYNCLIVKIAVYSSPGQLCGAVKSQPRATLCVALVGTWQVASLIALCFH